MDEREYLDRASLVALGAVMANPELASPPLNRRMGMLVKVSWLIAEGMLACRKPVPSAESRPVPTDAPSAAERFWQEALRVSKSEVQTIENLLEALRRVPRAYSPENAGPGSPKKNDPPTDG